MSEPIYATVRWTRRGEGRFVVAPPALERAEVLWDEDDAPGRQRVGIMDRADRYRLIVAPKVEEA